MAPMQSIEIGQGGLSQGHFSGNHIRIDPAERPSPIRDILLPETATLMSSPPSALTLLVPLLLLGACARSERPSPPAPAVPAAAGSAVSFSMRGFEKTDGDCAAPAGCAVVRLQFPEILKAPTPEARRALQGFIRDQWLAPSFGASRGDDPAALAEQYFRQRREILAANPGVPGKWWVRRGIDVLYQEDRVISLRYGDDSYSGGESPIAEVLLASFNPQTGRRFTLADLLAPGGEASLQALAAQRLRQIRGGSPGPLPLDGHFAVVEAGLLFRFNPFELPGETGVEPAQIVLTRGELQGLVRADGPLTMTAPRRAAFPSPEDAAEPEGGWESADVPR
jgi:hypothetical protein